MPGRLQDKVAIVTGGASGFGQGIAAKFVAEGAHVVIADLADEAGAAAAAELGGGGRCRFQHADVAKREDWVALLKATLEAFGGLDIVVNNAGATYRNKVRYMCFGLFCFLFSYCSFIWQS